MIKSLSEVQNKLLRLASFEKNPIFKKKYLMSSPGCSKQQILFLRKKIKTLPDSYLKLISSYSLSNISIDNFEISTRSYDKNIIEGLIEAFEDPFFPKEFMQKHKMYQIGSYNTDLLCVTNGTDVYKDGEILYIIEGYDIYNPEDDQIMPIAKDFEQFLIAAGNLEEIHQEIEDDESNYEEKKQEFFDRLCVLGVDERYYKAWKYVF